MAPKHNDNAEYTDDGAVQYDYDKERRQNGQLTMVQPLQNDGAGEKQLEKHAKGDSESQSQEFEFDGFKEGDRVTVNKIEVKRMKKLQKNHGGWNPAMENAIGKNGMIIHIFPDGDLRVRTDSDEMWTFNPECITFVEHTQAHDFKNGDKARLRLLPTEEMQRLQKASKGLWVPIVPEMKGHLCTVIDSKPYIVRVTMSNGVVFEANPGLLEKVDNDAKDEHLEHVYKKGDVVQIKRMEEKAITRLYEAYGVEFSKNVLKIQGSSGKVVANIDGRAIAIKTDAEPWTLCCPPMLKLVRECEESEDTGAELLSLLSQLPGLPATPPLPLMSQMLQIPHIREMTQEFTEGGDVSQQDTDLIRMLVRSQMELFAKLGEESDESDNDEESETETDEVGPSEESQTSGENFQEGDRVKVKQMSIDDMQKLQKHHGGWAKPMESAIGEYGTIVHVFSTGDVHVSMEDSLCLWCFSPKCVTLVEKSATAGFRVGQSVRFKHMPTNDMIQLQKNYGGWVPLMEDMKGRPCIITKRLARQLEVQMMDGYVWGINPKLVEVFDGEIHEANQHCFQKRDTVKILDMSREEMRDHFIHHGIAWSNAIYHARGKVGVVEKVVKGRIVTIQMTDGGNTFACCRKVLGLVHQSSKEEDGDASDEDDDDLEGTERKMELSFSLGPNGTEVSVGRVATSRSPKAILAASANGQLKEIRSILKKHPNWVDVISESGNNTALMNACADGNIEIVKFLVEAGARVDMENIDGNTPLIIAALKDEKDILEYLLDRGANLEVTNSKGQNALHVAISADSATSVAAILARCNKNDYDKQNKQGMKPVNLAILKKKDNTICELMLQSPLFDAGATTSRGFTALHEAAKVGNDFATKFILDKFPHVINCQKPDMWTALHLAAFNNNLDVLKTLLSYDNCEKNMLTKNGETALFLAITKGHKSAVEILLQHHADLNIPDEDGETCLSFVYNKLQEKYIKPDNSDSEIWPHLAILLQKKKAEGRLDHYLKDFHDHLKDVHEAKWVEQIFETTTFAARYVDENGGYLEIPDANVRLFIPPNAVSARQLVYINLDPVNYGIKRTVSPTVQCGPPGTKFERKVTLSYQHCIEDIAKWKLKTLTCDDDTDWQAIDSTDAESSINNGRVVVKTTHFTRYTTKTDEEEPAGTSLSAVSASASAAAAAVADNEDREPEKSALKRKEKKSKRMRIGAFGKDHVRRDPKYRFRVRTWDGTSASTALVRQEEMEDLHTKPLDSNRPINIYETEEDIVVEVNDIEDGWDVRHDGLRTQKLDYHLVWDDENPSITFDFRSDRAASESFFCAVNANQIGCPDRNVYFSISPDTISQLRAESTHQGRNIRKDLAGFPPKVPNLPNNYSKMCIALSNKDDINGDWRRIAEKLGLGDQSTIARIENICSTRDPKDSEANYVLKQYLLERHAEGSDDSRRDLLELFKELELYEALHYLENEVQDHGPSGIEQEDISTYCTDRLKGCNDVKPADASDRS